jgi:OmpA-OmpF porin, OOP family
MFNGRWFLIIWFAIVPAVLDLHAADTSKTHPPGNASGQPITVEAMQAALQRDGKVTLYGIDFLDNNVVFEMSSLDILKDLVILLQKNPDYKVDIRVHMAKEGSPKIMTLLSDQRAKRIQSFLMLFGINKSRLTTKGEGRELPIASNETEEGRALNRRVELVLIKE